MLQILTTLPNTYMYLNEPPEVFQLPADECRICLENLATAKGAGDPTKGCSEIRAGKALVGALKCGHLFHPGCIEEWAKRPDERPHTLMSCPLCRSPQDRLFFFGYNKQTQLPVPGNFVCAIKYGGKLYLIGMRYEHWWRSDDDIRWTIESAKLIAPGA